MTAPSYLDTNCLLRLILGDIEPQATAVAELLASGAALRISPICLAELVFVLGRHYKLSRSETVRLVEATLSLAQFETQPEHYRQSLHTWAAHPKLSFEDCLLADGASAEGAVLFTFDKKLARTLPAAVLLK